MSDEILAWLQFSIDTEIRGRKFYEECLKHAREQRSENLFSFLVEEELRHEKTLKELLMKKADNDQSRIDAAVQKFNNIKIENTMFSQEDLDAIKDPNALIMEMFNKSAEQEKKGINLYLDIEESNDDPEIKEFFHDLAKQEVLHRRKITNLGMHLFGMDEEEEDNSKEALEKELKSMKVILHEIDLEVKDCKFIPSDIRVKKGETVVLKVNVDAPAGIRMINFGLNEYISPGKPAVFKFIADTAGEFEYFSNVPCRLGNGGMRGMFIVEGENEPDEEL